ncbi:MAG: dipeptidase [Woeseiaceae bacterium]
MNKWIKWLLGLLVLLAGLFFLLAPGYVEQSLNRRVSVPISPATADALALHEKLLIADMHADTLLWKRSLLESSSRGHVDLPRLQAGNVGLQIFSTVTKSPSSLNYDSNSADSDTIGALAFAQLQPPSTWRSLLARSLWHAEKLETAIASSDRLVAIKTRDDLEQLVVRRQRGDPVVGAMLSVEGLHNLEGAAANLPVLFEAGYRMAGLTHFFDNALAGSMHGIEKGGLTQFGREIVRSMESMGMVVDIAHLSSRGVDEVLLMATRPVVVSHGGVRALCETNRNLSDAQIRGIAQTGGVIGVGYWAGALCDTRPASVAKAIVYIRDLVGIEHAGLGSDFDGAVTVSFDASELALITQALMDEGLTDHEISLVMGLNVMRVLATVLPSD